MAYMGLVPADWKETTFCKYSFYYLSNRPQQRWKNTVFLFSVVSYALRTLRERFLV